jgi:hypothetical protein
LGLALLKHLVKLLTTWGLWITGNLLFLLHLLGLLIVFSLHRESLKLILAMNPFPRWFCHSQYRRGGARRRGRR